MAQINLSDFLFKLRARLEEHTGDDSTFLAAYDRAVAESVVSLVDGNAPEQPKKRSYTRKPKPSNPPAE